MNADALKKETIPPLHSNHAQQLRAPLMFATCCTCSTYNGVPWCMSTNPCQYDLNQWSKLLLVVRPVLQ